MFYSLGSILFPTLDCETSKHSHFNLLKVCVSNTSDTESRSTLAAGNEMDMASLTFITSKQYLYHA